MLFYRTHKKYLRKRLLFLSVRQAGLVLFLEQQKKEQMIF